MTQRNERIKAMIERAAYVRSGYLHYHIDICSMATPLPAALFEFGYQCGDFLRIATPTWDFAQAWVALDWLRDHGWTVSPDVPQFGTADLGYLTLTEVRERGWPARLIELYLSIPDVKSKNPHHRRGSPMKMYAQCRLSLLETLHDVAEILNRKRLRQERFDASLLPAQRGSTNG